MTPTLSLTHPHKIRRIIGGIVAGGHGRVRIGRQGAEGRGTVLGRSRTPASGQNVLHPEGPPALSRTMVENHHKSEKESHCITAYFSTPVENTDALCGHRSTMRGRK
jgi:hypothetical protein